MAIDEVTSHLPRSTREVTLLHWVCHWPQLWHGIEVMDILYAPQWMDTHSHPAWYYPHAAHIHGYQVLLAIHAPKGTPMMRIHRHSSYQYRAELLRSGEWTHTEYDPTETEVRLPPGRYQVETPPTFELYAGNRILLVELLYEPWTFRPCKKTMLQRLSSARGRKRSPGRSAQSQFSSTPV